MKLKNYMRHGIRKSERGIYNDKSYRTMAAIS